MATSSSNSDAAAVLLASAAVRARLTPTAAKTLRRSLAASPPPGDRGRANHRPGITPDPLPLRAPEAALVAALHAAATASPPDVEAARAAVTLWPTVRAAAEDDGRELDLALAAGAMTDARLALERLSRAPFWPMLLEEAAGCAVPVAHRAGMDMRRVGTRCAKAGLLPPAELCAAAAALAELGLALLTLPTPFLSRPISRAAARAHLDLNFYHHLATRGGGGGGGGGAGHRWSPADVARAEEVATWSAVRGHVAAAQALHASLALMVNEAKITLGWLVDERRFWSSGGAPSGSPEASAMPPPRLGPRPQPEEVQPQPQQAQLGPARAAIVDLMLVAASAGLTLCLPCPPEHEGDPVAAAYSAIRAPEAMPPPALRVAAANVAQALRINWGMTYDLPGDEALGAPVRQWLPRVLIAGATNILFFALRLRGPPARPLFPDAVAKAAASALAPLVYLIGAPEFDGKAPWPNVLPSVVAVAEAPLAHDHVTIYAQLACRQAASFFRASEQQLRLSSFPPAFVRVAVTLLSSKAILRVMRDFRVSLQANALPSALSHDDRVLLYTASKSTKVKRKVWARMDARLSDTELTPRQAIGLQAAFQEPEDQPFRKTLEASWHQVKNTPSLCSVLLSRAEAGLDFARLATSLAAAASPALPAERLGAANEQRARVEAAAALLQRMIFANPNCEPDVAQSALALAYQEVPVDPRLNETLSRATLTELLSAALFLRDKAGAVGPAGAAASELARPLIELVQLAYGTMMCQGPRRLVLEALYQAVQPLGSVVDLLALSRLSGADPRWKGSARHRRQRCSYIKCDSHGYMDDLHPEAKKKCASCSASYFCGEFCLQKAYATHKILCPVLRAARESADAA